MGHGGAEEAATFPLLPRVQEPGHLAHTWCGPQGSLFHRGLQPLLPQTQESRPLALLPPTQIPSPQPLLPLTQESGPNPLLPQDSSWDPALAFPDLEKPGEDVKLKDGHVATAGEVDGGAQGQGYGAWLHRVAGTQERLKLSPGQHTPGRKGDGTGEASGSPGWEEL